LLRPKTVNAKSTNLKTIHFYIFFGTLKLKLTISYQMSELNRNREKYADVMCRMQETGYDVMRNTDYICTGVNYVIDIFDEEICVFVAPDPCDDDFGDGLNIGRLVGAELCYSIDNGARYAYIKV
jgi:hypothetical protein